MSHLAPDDRVLLMRDIVDGQLDTLDGRRIGRAADVEGHIEDDGRLVLRRIVLGPEAHAGRVSRRLAVALHRLLDGRYEHAIELAEVDEIGLTLRLRKRADEYDVGGADRWIVEHVFRWIPGGGR
jgi:hypothetical protein